MHNYAPGNSLTSAMPDVSRGLSAGDAAEQGGGRMDGHADRPGNRGHVVIIEVKPGTSRHAIRK